MLTIASPNTDRSLLTLAELRAAAGVSDGSSDATLVPLGNYISAMITRACKVARAGAIPPTLRLETVTDTLRLKSAQGNLVLSRRPVVEITSVAESGSALDASYFECDTAAGIIYKLASTARTDWPIGSIVIEYSAGYDVVPDDLKYAAMKFVKSELSSSARDPTLKSLEIVGVSRREWWIPDNPSNDTVVPTDVMDILVRGGYANMVVA
jgi:hypothetical protein